MPVTGWLRGTVKAVPSGDTVLIVANAGPTVRFYSFITHISLSSCCSFVVLLRFFYGRIISRGRQNRSDVKSLFLSFTLSLLLSFAIKTIVSYSQVNAFMSFSFFKRSSLTMQ